MNRTTRLSSAALALVVVLAPVARAAAETMTTTTTTSIYQLPSQEVTLDDQHSTGPAMVLDLVLVRPLGLVATVVGTVFFVAGLPFAAATRSIPEAGHYLVKEPAWFTFQRPLGDLSDDSY